METEMRKRKGWFRHDKYEIFDYDNYFWIEAKRKYREKKGEKLKWGGKECIVIQKGFVKEEERMYVIFWYIAKF